MAATNVYLTLINIWRYERPKPFLLYLWGSALGVTPLVRLVAKLVSALLVDGGLNSISMARGPGER